MLSSCNLVVAIIDAIKSPLVGLYTGSVSAPARGRWCWVEVSAAACCSRCLASRRSLFSCRSTSRCFCSTRTELEGFQAWEVGLLVYILVLFGSFMS